MRECVASGVPLKTSLILFWFLSTTAKAILPLPFPPELPEDEEPAEIERDPKSVPAYYELYSGGQKREMRLPQFGDQVDALGYSGLETFMVPHSLRTRVDFWKKIYTEVSSQEALLHDAEYPEITYGIVNLSEFEKDPSLSYRQKMRLINNYLKVEKRKIEEKLKLLESLEANPLQIPIEAFGLFTRFEKISNPNKFRSAAKRVRAQIGQRDKLVQGFLFGGRYFSHMMQVFEREKLPKELTRLPMVESAFNLAAKSRVGASGIWQFMRSTGKRFLRIDRLVDERNDPILASVAAAKLLRQNYEGLGSWPLAITAYNHGREGMSRAVRELATRDLNTIIRQYRSRTFGFASANFYSEFLAILEVEKEYRKHFGLFLVDPPLEIEELVLAKDEGFATLAIRCNMSQHDLEIINPALSDIVVSGKAPIPKDYPLRVLKGLSAKCVPPPPDRPETKVKDA